MTRYFGKEANNPSGFVCVEFAELPPPYLIVSRLAHLESHTKSSKAGMRFDIEADVDANPWRMSTDIPEMGFLRDCWPRFISTAQGFDVNIEYRIYKDTVYPSIYIQEEETRNSRHPIYSTANHHR